jgi:hypothetical protein
MNNPSAKFGISGLQPKDFERYDSVDILALADEINQQIRNPGSIAENVSYLAKARYALLGAAAEAEKLRARRCVNDCTPTKETIEYEYDKWRESSFSASPAIAFAAGWRALYKWIMKTPTFPEASEVPRIETEEISQTYADVLMVCQASEAGPA